MYSVSVLSHITLDKVTCKYKQSIQSIHSKRCHQGVALQGQPTDRYDNKPISTIGVVIFSQKASLFLFTHDKEIKLLI